MIAEDNEQEGVLQITLYRKKDVIYLQINLLYGDYANTVLLLSGQAQNNILMTWLKVIKHIINMWSRGYLK